MGGVFVVVVRQRIGASHARGEIGALGADGGRGVVIAGQRVGATRTADILAASIGVGCVWVVVAGRSVGAPKRDAREVITAAVVHRRIGVIVAAVGVGAALARAKVA